MSYSEMAQLELMNALNSINSEAELNEFKDLVARYFAEKAQKAIDALWDEGVINEETIEQWGEEHMRTPYRYAAHRFNTTSLQIVLWPQERNSSLQMTNITTFLPKYLGQILKL